MKKIILLTAIAAGFISSAALALPAATVSCPPMADVQSVIQNIKTYDADWHGGSSGPIYRLHYGVSPFLPSSIVTWMLNQADPQAAILAVRVPKENDISGISWLNAPVAVPVTFGVICQYSTASATQMNAVVLCPQA